MDILGAQVSSVKLHIWCLARVAVSKAFKKLSTKTRTQLTKFKAYKKHSENAEVKIHTKLIMQQEHGIFLQCSSGQCKKKW